MPGPTELLILLMLLVVIGAVLLFVLSRSRGPRDADAEHETTDARQLLDKRYARGELGREEYQQMREDIES